MKKYRVNVNGTNYEIELELVSENDAKTSSPAPVVAAAPVAPATIAAPSAPVPEGEGTIKAPMPGNILSINVAVGDTIKKGHNLMILEAMKMENEILSPVDGKILSVNVNVGATVNAGAVLCVIG